MVVDAVSVGEIFYDRNVQAAGKVFNHLVDAAVVGTAYRAVFKMSENNATDFVETRLHADLLPLLERALAGKLTATHSTVLSPFDPVVWDRKRAEQLFDFSYRLECYTPAPKRQYGYFVLPLLHRGQLVGRMDAKMHRQTGIFEVISLWLQEGIKPTTTLQKGLRQAITDFANWQQATRVTLRRCPQGLFTDCRTGWEIDPVA